MFDILEKWFQGEHGKVLRDSFSFEFKKISGNNYGMCGSWLEEEGRYETLTDSFNKEHRIWATSGKCIKEVIDNDYYDISEYVDYRTMSLQELGGNGLMYVYDVDEFNLFDLKELSGIRLFVGHFPYLLIGNKPIYKQFFEYIVFKEKKDILGKYGMVIRNPQNDYMGDVARSIKELITDEDKKYIKYGTMLDWGWNNSYILLLDFRKYLEYFYYNIELKEKLFNYRKDIGKRSDMSLEYALFREPTVESFAAFMFRKRAGMRKVLESVNYKYI